VPRSWAAGADIQGGLIANALMPFLIGACLDVSHDLVVAQRETGLDASLDVGRNFVAHPERLRRVAPNGKRKPGPMTNEDIVLAVRRADPPDISMRFRARVQKEVATAENYAFDVKLGLTVRLLTRHNLLTGSPSVVGSGENQNIGGLHTIDTLTANQRQLLPLLGVLRTKLGEELGACKSTHTHAPYAELSGSVRALLGAVGQQQAALLLSQNDCEDVTTQLAIACNAACVMSQAHQRHQALQRHEMVCSCRLCHCLGVYACATLHDAEFMPAVAAMIHAIAAASSSLGIGLVFTSGANRDLVTTGASVPQSVGHAVHGVYPVLRTSLQACLACGHAVAVDIRRQALHAAHPWNSMLAALHGENCCPTLRL